MKQFLDQVIFRKSHKPLGYRVTLALNCSIILRGDTQPVLWEGSEKAKVVGTAKCEVIGEVVVADITIVDEELLSALDYLGEAGRLDFSANGVVFERNVLGEATSVEIRSVQACFEKVPPSAFNKLPGKAAVQSFSTGVTMEKEKKCG